MHVCELPSLFQKLLLSRYSKSIHASIQPNKYIVSVYYIQSMSKI